MWWSPAKTTTFFTPPLRVCGGQGPLTFLTFLVVDHPPEIVPEPSWTMSLNLYRCKNEQRDVTQALEPCYKTESITLKSRLAWVMIQRQHNYCRVLRKANKLLLPYNDHRSCFILWLFVN